MPDGSQGEVPESAKPEASITKATRLVFFSQIAKLDAHPSSNTFLNVKKEAVCEKIAFTPLTSVAVLTLKK